MSSNQKTIKLNKAQEQAVKHVEGPVLVVAGSGTGKTSVIVERLARMIEHGVKKREILVLTFTEKAAQEMLDRASQHLQSSYGAELNIYTFNAFGAERLSEFAVEIGLSSNQKLVGDNGKIVLMRENLDALGLEYFSPVSRPEGQLKDIADYFSKLKQQLVKSGDYVAYASKLPQSDKAEKLDKQRHTELAQAYGAYQQIMRKRNIIDYDDQIYLLIELLESRPNVLKTLQDRYKYIMVDEFQDTNPMQSRLIDLLAGKDRNVFVVGDDDQSIYGWRGATLANILEFPKRYPQYKEVTLIENFRSTQEILDSAWQLIQNNNPNRLEYINNLDKRLVASRGKGTKPIFHCFTDLNSELNWVAGDIKKKIADGIEPGQIAVLGRSKNTVDRMHRMLDANNVEHTVSGIGSDLYQQPAVASLLEALRAIVEPNNNLSLYHTLTSQLFSCDPGLMSTQLSTSRSHHEPIVDLLNKLDDKRINDALTKIESLRSKAFGSVRELAYNILAESGFKDYLYTNAEKDSQAAEDLLALGQWFDTLYDYEKFSSLPSAVNYLDNLEALRAEGEMVNDDNVNVLTTLPAVMTVHKAKGLEWDVVYVIDCTEQSFPLKNRANGLVVPAELSLSSAADDHYYEERRLMYVAVTRAANQLILSFSQSHNGITKRKPSRFLNEMYGDIELASQQGEKYSFDFDSLNNTKQPDKLVALPNSMLQNGHVVLTASEADDYLTCPLNFYYKPVLNVPERPSAATAVGSLFHGLIQEINTAKRDGKVIPKLNDLINRLESEWPAVGYSSTTQRQRALKLGLSSFRNLYERLAKEPVPLAVEEPFRIQLPNSKLILKGRIDTVLKDGTGVQIHDYKTSTSVQTAEKAKSKTTSSNQLVMYALAWRILHDEDPVSVCLDFVQTGQVGIVKKRPDSLDKMHSKLTDAAQDIIDQKFPAGAKHEFCIHPI